MSQEVIAVLEYISQQLGLTMNWTSENVLPLWNEMVQKYANYAGAKAILWIVIGNLLIFAGCILIVIAYKYNKHHRKDRFYCYDSTYEYLLVSAVICFLIGVPMAIWDVCSLIEIKTFPELHFIKYVKNVFGKQIK